MLADWDANLEWFTNLEHRHIVTVSRDPVTNAYFSKEACTYLTKQFTCLSQMQSDAGNNDRMTSQDKYALIQRNNIISKLVALIQLQISASNMLYTRYCILHSTKYIPACIIGLIGHWTQLYVMDHQKMMHVLASIIWILHNNAAAANDFLNENGYSKILSLYQRTRCMELKSLIYSACAQLAQNNILFGEHMLQCGVVDHVISNVYWDQISWDWMDTLGSASFLFRHICGHESCIEAQCCDADIAHPVNSAALISAARKFLMVRCPIYTYGTYERCHEDVCKGISKLAKHPLHRQRLFQDFMLPPDGEQKNSIIRLIIRYCLKKPASYLAALCCIENLMVTNDECVMIIGMNGIFERLTYLLMRYHHPNFAFGELYSKPTKLKLIQILHKIVSLSADNCWYIVNSRHCKRFLVCMLGHADDIAVSGIACQILASITAHATQAYVNLQVLTYKAMQCLTKHMNIITRMYLQYNKRNVADEKWITYYMEPAIQLLSTLLIAASEEITHYYRRINKIERIVISWYHHNSTPDEMKQKITDILPIFESSKHIRKQCISNGTT